MDTTTIISLSTLLFAVSGQICNQVGVCSNSTFLVPLPANSSSECMEKCKNYGGCNFGSFTSDYNPNLCLLSKTCTSLDTESCPNCETSEISCSQCDVPGLCLVSIKLAKAWSACLSLVFHIFYWKNSFFIQGRIIHSETSEDKIACWSLCKSTDGCNWFSFKTVGDQTCILLEDCSEIEENPQFISGQKECDFGNGE